MRWCHRWHIFVHLCLCVGPPEALGWARKLPDHGELCLIKQTNCEEGNKRTPHHSEECSPPKSEGERYDPHRTPMLSRCRDWTCPCPRPVTSERGTSSIVNAATKTTYIWFGKVEDTSKGNYTKFGLNGIDPLDTRVKSVRRRGRLQGTLYNTLFHILLHTSMRKLYIYI